MCTPEATCQQFSLEAVQFKVDWDLSTRAVNHTCADTLTKIWSKVHKHSYSTQDY